MAFYRRYLEHCNDHRFEELGEFVGEGVRVNGTAQGLDRYVAGLRALVALLVFDDAGGSLDLRRLAAELTASVSDTSGVCDRMQEAGLLTVGDAASSRAGLCCTLTGSGRRLAAG